MIDENRPIEIIQEHLNKGGTVMRAMMVPIGAALLIVHKEQIQAIGIGVHGLIDLEVSYVLKAINKIQDHGPA